ncbi:pilin [Massilia sp. Se16.2.3]|uniref:pilin n=1 Tax=Massilia sp. Se16.2.3 TaxID=2709303 RepID=UPI0016043897|nr:pilin [Massilia sp. Se16.2.3]
MHPFGEAIENTSGMGKFHALPDGVARWSWGGFVFSWIWAVCNGNWIGLLALFPGIGFVMRIVLGVNGRKWAWQNRRWDSVAHFNRVQRRWSIAALVFGLAIPGIGIVAAVAIPMYQDSQYRAPLAAAHGYANEAAQAVGRHIAAHRALPRDLDEAGFRAPLPASVDHLAIDPRSGQLLVTVNVGRLRGKTFSLAPTLEADGSISWRCLYGEIPRRQLPKACSYNVADPFAL